MIPTPSVKGHTSTVSAYAEQKCKSHIINLIGTRESVWVSLAAMQHGHSAVLKAKGTTLVNLGSKSIKVIQGRFPSGPFRAIACGQGLTQGDILVLKQDDFLAARLCKALLTKSSLPYHNSWQRNLHEIARKGNPRLQNSSSGVQVYALDNGLGAFGT